MTGLEEHRLRRTLLSLKKYLDRNVIKLEAKGAEFRQYRVVLEDCAFRIESARINLENHSKIPRRKRKTIGSQSAKKYGLIANRRLRWIS